MKVNVDGRIMVDPKAFRHTNPNYCISTLSAKVKDILSDPESDDHDEFENSSDEEGPNHTIQFAEAKKEPKHKEKIVEDKETGIYHCMELPVDEGGNVVQEENIEKIWTEKDCEFSDEEYLIASPVALGFSFDEKLWLEFAVSSIEPVIWNESAFDSLIIPHKQKHIIKSLVESHERNAKKNIEDIVQGQCPPHIWFHSPLYLQFQARDKVSWQSYMDHREPGKLSRLNVSRRCSKNRFM